MSREDKLKVVKRVAFGILAVVLMVIYITSGSDIEEISISDFKKNIKQEKLEKVEIKPRLILGVYKHETADTLVAEKESWDIKAKYLGESAPDDVKALLDDHDVYYK